MEVDGKTPGSGFLKCRPQEQCDGPLVGSGLPVCRYPARRHPIIIIGVIPQTRHGRVNFSRVASVRGEDTGLPPTHAPLENIVRDRERCIRLSSSTEKIGCISLYERLGRCRWNNQMLLRLSDMPPRAFENAVCS